MATARRVFCSLAFLAVAELANAQSTPRDLCSLFTTAEIAALFEVPVEDGEAAAMGSGCQWFGTDEESYVMLQVLDGSYWFDPQGAPGYEVLDGAGERAYSHPEEGGWRAMALSDGLTVAVVMNGRSAQRASTVTLMRQLVDRL